MAENEAQNGQEATSTDPTQQGAQDQPKESKKLLLIIIAVVVVLITVIAAVLVVILTADEDTGMITGTEEERQYVNEYNQHMQLVLDPIKEPIFTEPYTYTVNLKGDRRYIQLSIRAILKDPLAKTFLDARTPIIDDSMITLLKSITPTELQTRAGLEILKRRIYLIFNKIYTDEFIKASESKDRTPVKEILIIDFHIQ